MDGNQGVRNERNYKCSMCVFSTRIELHLVHHYVRRHRFDPRFRVNCNYLACGASFSKWDSFKKHLQRVHRNRPHNDDRNAIDDIDQLFHVQEVENGNAPVAENPREEDNRQLLQLEAARFLVHLRDVCNTSHRAMAAVMAGVDVVIKRFVMLLMREVRHTAEVEDGFLTVEDFQRICTDQCPPSLIFSHVDSKRKLDTFMVNHLNFIKPREIELGRTRVWRRRPTVDLVEKISSGFCIPLLLSLQRMLLNDDVRNCVENHRDGGDTMKTILDGNYFKSHPFFSSHRNPLAIVLYYDELEIVNPLGSRTHKLGMFYWTLANVYPEFRSSLKAVNLYAIARYSDLKKWGIGRILTEFVREINILQTEGVTVSVNGHDKTFKGSLLIVAGDTPASAHVGGFKQSVSASRFCRRCMTDVDRWRLYFTEDHFTLRCMQSHREHLEAISDPESTAQNRRFWSQAYGVNERSELLDIDGFDITKCLVQDIMHVLSEGVIEVEMRLFIQYCVNENFFTLPQLNERITNFDYGHLNKDKPSPNLIVDHLNNKHLRQSASQMVCLAHVLPFLISEYLVGDDGNEDGAAHARLLCHTKLMQIVNFCFAYEMSIDDAHFLGSLIENFLNDFCALYGRDAMVPKFHFLTHVVSQIEEFGPLRQHFCYRFEAANARYKYLARVVRCFKNMPWTLAYRHETNRCLEFNGPGEPSTRFLYLGHYIKEGAIMKLSEVPDHNYILELLQVAIDLNECNVMISPEVSVWGTTFRKQSLILLSCEEEDMPQFGRIQCIVVYEGNIFFLYEELKTGLYYQSLNAYHIQRIAINPQKGAINIKNLRYIHPLSSFRWKRENLVILFNHTRTEVIN